MSAAWALWLSLLALVVLLIAGPLVRFGVLSYRTGLLMLPLAAGIAAFAMILSVVALARGRAFGRPILALLIGAAVAAVPAGGYLRARSVPPIHDISTDPTEQSQAQRPAYPDIQPLRLPVAPNIAYERAKGAVEEMGWQLVREDPSAGRLEAVATTFWFGFRNDVVIRVSAAAGGSRVDVRSKSRVGVSDLGTNARRIRVYQQRLR